MHAELPHLLSVLSLLILCATVPSQPGAPSSPPRTVTCSLVERDGVWCADGPAYTAAFTAHGPTFTPALGRRAPRSFPVRFALASIHREGGAGEDVTPTAPNADAEHVTYARGPNVVERWRVQQGGLALSYVFARRPEGHGDLIVRLSIDSGLEFATPAADGGAHLHHPSFGGIHIGGVTGIDALGTHAPGSVELAAECLELRLPATFVDHARYPMVLDPLIGTLTQVGTGDDANADVAYEASSQTYLVVFERTIAANQVEVLGQRYNPQGSPIGGLIAIRTGGNRIASVPAVCSVASRARFVVAWREGSTLLGPWAIRSCAVNPDGTVSSILTNVSGGATHGPRLGGDAVGDRAILLSAQDGSVRIESLSVPAGSGAPNHVGLGSIPATRIQGLSLTRSGGSPRRWVGVATLAIVLPPYPYLEAFAIDMNGQVVDRNVFVEATVSLFSTASAIDGNGTDFLSVYARDRDIRCQRLWWTGSALATVGNETAITNDTAVESEPAVAWLGPKYLVAWAKNGATPFDHSIQGIALQSDTCVPCSNRFTIDLPGYDFGPAIGAQRAAGPTAGDQALIAFTSNQVTLPLAGKVFVQRFDAQTEGVVTNLGGQCGGSYVASTIGPVAIGNPALRIQVAGVSGATAAFLHIGAAGAAPLPCGPCRITLPLVQVPATVSGNLAIVPFPIACSPELIGGQLEVQFLVLSPSSSACPLVRGLAFSDRLQLEIGH